MQEQIYRIAYLSEETDIYFYTKAKDRSEGLDIAKEQFNKLEDEYKNLPIENITIVEVLNETYNIENLNTVRMYFKYDAPKFIEFQ